MDCDEIREALDAYALGALTPAEAETVATHVTDCADCQGYLDGSNQVVGWLALAVPLHRPIPKLRPRILAAAEHWAEMERIGPWRRLMRAALPIAAALALAVAGSSLGWALHLQGRISEVRGEALAQQRLLQVLNTHITQEHGLVAAMAAPDRQAVSLLASSAGRNASGTYFWSRSAGRGGFVGVNLPTLPPGKVFHMWLFKDGKAYSAGAFQSFEGMAQYAVNFELIGITPPFTAFGVSIEDHGRTPLGPTSAPVLYAERPTD